MTTMTGKCLCGAVSFEAKGVETHHHACHCAMCRRWSGGPLFAAPVESVSFQGEEAIGVYESSTWAERAFCKACGSNLFYRVKQTGQHIISIGTFDDTEAFKLVGEIFIDQKPDGYNFAGDLPKKTEAEVFAMFSGED